MECSLENSGKGISSSQFNPWNDEMIAITTWDGSVEYFDASSGFQSNYYSIEEPQLCLAWIDANSVVTGGARGTLSINGDEIGHHDKGVSCVSYVTDSESEIIVSGSWDGMLKCWDPKSNSLICDLNTKMKINCMTNAPPQSIICGCNENVILTYDTRKLDVCQTRKRINSYQIRSIAANETFLAIGFYEGRVSIESRELEEESFSFKAHIVKEEDGISYVYPVNALAFDPTTGYLATGGSNGVVIIWNIIDHSKVLELPKKTTSVSSISYNKKGYISTAISYCWEKGDIEPTDDYLYIDDFSQYI